MSKKVTKKSEKGNELIKRAFLLVVSIYIFSLVGILVVLWSINTTDTHLEVEIDIPNPEQQKTKDSTPEEKPQGKEQEKEEFPKDTESNVLDYTLGLSVGGTLLHSSREELTKTLDDFVALGVGWVRSDLSWGLIQPDNKESYNWSSFDLLVEEANARNIRVLPILAYTPYWARHEECSHSSKCRPKNNGDFADFAEEAVKRYREKGIVVWEVWNEPNITKFWAGGASAYEYTNLLKSTYEAIHSVDADAVVLSGGLAPASTKNGNISPREYLERMYENSVQGYFDALAFHPYTFPRSPNDTKNTNAWSQLSGIEWTLRSIMEAYGDGEKKIWLTEYGAPTGGPGRETDGSTMSLFTSPTHVTETYQAELIKEAVLDTRKYTWDGPLFIYSYKDLGTDTGTIENFFGLRRNDDSKKESYNTLQNLTQ